MVLGSQWRWGISLREPTRRIFRVADSDAPGRIISAATGQVDMAGYSFLDVTAGKPPNLLTGAADAQLRNLTKGTDISFIGELFATVAEEHQPQGDLTGRKLILFVGNEAASAALPKGATSFGVALILVDRLRPIAAKVNIVLWADRAPLAVNPADATARGGLTTS